MVWREIMKMNNTVNQMGKKLITFILLSQLAACNFMATATGAAGDVQRTSGVDNFDTEIVASETDSIAEVVGRSVINKTLSWTAPVVREDASPISMAEIAGFRVYYRAAQGEYKQYVEINDAYVDELDLSVFNFGADADYLAITTIDSNGLESAFSEEIFLGSNV